MIIRLSQFNLTEFDCQLELSLAISLYVLILPPQFTLLKNSYCNPKNHRNIVKLAQVVRVAASRPQAVNQQRQQWTVISLILFHFPFHFLHHNLFSYNTSSDQKTSSKSCLQHPFPDPVGHFGALSGGHFGLDCIAGDATVQASIF